MTMTPDQIEIFDRLTPTTRDFLMAIVRRLLRAYDGEIVLLVKRGGISRMRWVQIDDGESIKKQLYSSDVSPPSK